MYELYFNRYSNCSYIRLYDFHYACFTMSIHTLKHKLFYAKFNLILNVNWYTLQAYALLSIGIFFGIKMYFMFHLQLISKSSIGILKNFFYLQVVPTFVLSTTICFKLISKFILLTSRNFKILFWVVSKFSLKICWYVLLICKRSLTSALYRFILSVFYILRSLTSLLYVLHVCRGSLTSPSIHCILCLYGLGFVIPSPCNACMQGEFLTVSPLHEFISHIYLSCLLSSTLCWSIDKKGKKNLEFIYAYLIFLFLHLYLCLVYALHWISLLFLLCMS